MRLTQKTLLITGGNSGIGFALVKLLCVENRIIVISRSENNWPQLKRLDSQIITLRCDLSNYDAVVQLCQQLQSEFPEIDVLINGAAVQFTPTFIDKDFSFEGIQQEITTNFTAVAWLSHQLLSQLLQRNEASIVNISSGLAIYPKTHSAIYCASKAALHSFSQSLRYQLEDTEIRVIEVLMPLVDTPMTEGRGNRKISAKQAASAIIAAIQGRSDEVYIGKARVLPILSRLWPGLIKNILKRD